VTAGPGRAPTAGHELVPGDERSPVLLHVPHAGTRIPGWVRRHLLLDDAELAAEVAALTDHRTDAIALAAADLAAVRPWTVINRMSRFVVDVERLPDEREPMAAVGMATVYTRGTRGQPLRADDPQHRDALLAAYSTPWAAIVRDAVEQRLAHTGRAVLIDVHSYPSRRLPYERPSGGSRPATCLGTDPVHTPPTLVDAARRAFAPLGPVALDTPFRGTYVPLAHLGRDPRVSSIMIEVRRDRYLLEPTGLPAVARALGTLVDGAAGT
jgi:N-formylglutamate deformylase